MSQVEQFPSNAVVIVGGGLSGLVAGCLLARARISAPIFIVERSAEPGGLLRSFDGGRFGRFDHGMHTFTSANLPDLDNFMLDLKPHDEWVVMAGKDRDISGVFFEGRLERACHYPDLRRLPDPIRGECIADFCLNLGNAEAPSTTLDAFVSQRFGEKVSAHVIAPILEKLYGIPASELDPVVAKIFPFDRIALYDEPGVAELMESARVRTRVAYPEQRNLDPKYASTRYSLYPREYGSFRLIDALLARLKDAGVTVLTGTGVESLGTDKGRVGSLVLRRGEERIELKSPQQVIWTVGYPMLGRQLGLKAAETPFESRRASAAVGLLLDKPVDLGDLYYFWNWDRRFKTYRVANYCGYCPTAPRAGGFPLGFELVIPPNEMPPKEELGALAERELREMGLVPAGARVLFSIGDVLPVGFPAFSLANRRLLERYQTELNDRQISNLSVTGIQAEWGIVFQPEVLSHAYHTVGAFLRGAES